MPKCNLAVALAAAVAIGASPVSAADLPRAPIALVVGFAAGGGIDAFARLVAKRAGELTGRTFVVDNRPGAGGTIAAGHVARSAGDGRTILVGENGVISTAPSIFDALPYDPADLAPVMLAATQSVVLAVKAGTATSLSDLIDRARARPGSLNYASAGIGNPTHLFAADFARRAEIDIIHVPYRGGGQMLAAILGTDAQIGFFSMTTALPQVRSGGLTALAIGDDAPAAQLPDVPPATRTLPGFDFRFWYGFNVSAQTPPALIGTLNAMFRDVLNDPDVARTLTGQGLTIVASSPEAYHRFSLTEAERWGPLAKAAGVRGE